MRALAPLARRRRQPCSSCRPPSVRAYDVRRDRRRCCPTRCCEPRPGFSRHRPVLAHPAARRAARPPARASRSPPPRWRRGARRRSSSSPSTCPRPPRPAPTRHWRDDMRALPADRRGRPADPGRRLQRHARPLRAAAPARPRLPRRRRAGRERAAHDLADRHVAGSRRCRHRPRARRPPRAGRLRAPRGDPRLRPPTACSPSSCSPIPTGAVARLRPCCSSPDASPRRSCSRCSSRACCSTRSWRAAKSAARCSACSGSRCSGSSCSRSARRPGLTRVALFLGAPATVLLLIQAVTAQRRPAALLVGVRGRPLLLRRRRADPLHARRPHHHPRRAVGGRRDVHAARVGVRLHVHGRAGGRARQLHRRGRSRGAAQLDGAAVPQLHHAHQHRASAT